MITSVKLLIKAVSAMLAAIFMTFKSQLALKHCIALDVNREQFNTTSNTVERYDALNSEHCLTQPRRVKSRHLRQIWSTHTIKRWAWQEQRYSRMPSRCAESCRIRLISFCPPAAVGNCVFCSTVEIKLELGAIRVQPKRRGKRKMRASEQETKREKLSCFWLWESYARFDG